MIAHPRNLELFSGDMHFPVFSNKDAEITVQLIPKSVSWLAELGIALDIIVVEYGRATNTHPIGSTLLLDSAFTNHQRPENSCFRIPYHRLDDGFP